MAVWKVVGGKAHSRNFCDTDYVKLIVIGSFVLLSVLMTILVFSEYGKSLNSSLLFLIPQIYYIPIIFLSIWYPKRSAQATILIVIAFMATIAYYNTFEISIDPFVAGLNAAIYLWVIIATTHLAHTSGLISLKYLNFFNNANAGLIIFDKETGAVTDINQKAAEIFGSCVQDVIGRKPCEFNDVISKDNMCLSGIVFESGDFKDKKFTFNSKSGGLITVLASCVNNSLQNTVECTVVDITKQEAENKNISTERQRLLDFVNSSRDLMFVLDEKGSLLKFIRAEDSGDEGEFDDVIGKTLQNIIETPKEQEYLTLIKTVMDEGRTIPFDAEVILKGKKRVFFAIFGPYVDLNGDTKGIIGTLHEKNKKRKDSYESLIREFETRRWNSFVNTAAHELRTPLQPVLGYLHLLLDEPQLSGINEGSVQILRKCLVSVERECSIVEKMLEAGIMNSCTVRLLLSDVVLSEIIHDVISIGGYSLEAEISVDIPDLLTIRADRDRIYQVFEGIISNAIKYNSFPRKLDVSYEGDDKTHKIIFRDNGMGIPSDSFENIFEPFYITHPDKLSREYGRIGLGLSIARKYVRVHGGDISVLSTEGKGSTFVVTLPKEIPDLCDEARSISNTKNSD